MLYIIGETSRLGQAVAASYGADHVQMIGRNVYQAWCTDNCHENIAAYFDPEKNAGSVIFIAAGLLDPALPESEHLKLNYFLPRNIINSVTKYGLKVITCGTVMEGLIKKQNFYIQSKTRLSDYISSLTAEQNPALHLRIHTLFGYGQPSSFMFLGQILTAIKENAAFKMTPGKQLREYHHVNDEAAAITRIMNTSDTFSGILTLSHGQPVTLKNIAENIFTTLGKQDLLHIGAIPEPAEENYERIYERPDIINDIPFRDSIPAITDYMKTLI